MSTSLLIRITMIMSLSAVGGLDGSCAELKKLQTESGLLSIQLAHAREIRSTSGSNDGDMVIAVHRDATAWIWNIKSGKPVGPFKTTGASLSVKISFDKKKIIELDTRGFLHFRQIGPSDSGDTFSISVCRQPKYLWVLESSTEVLCVSGSNIERWTVTGNRKIYLGLVEGVNSESKFSGSASGLAGFHPHAQEIIYLLPDSGLRRLPLPHRLSPSVAAVSTESGDVVIGTSGRSICLWSRTADAWSCSASPAANHTSGDRNRPLSDPFNAIAISADGRYVVASSPHHLIFMNPSQGAVDGLKKPDRRGTSKSYFTPETAVASGVHATETAGTSRPHQIPERSLNRLKEIRHAGSGIREIFFSGRQALIAKPQSISIADPVTSTEIGIFCILRADAWSGTWAVLSPDGFFDSGDIESARDLFSVAPEDAESTSEILDVIFPADVRHKPSIVRLSPMIRVSAYMRDYFQPGLLSLLMNGQFRPKSTVRSVKTLNRAVPEVRFNEPLKCKEHGCPDQLAQVTVTAAPQNGFVSRAGRITRYRTDVYDLRLFRNGQLVGQWPKPAVGNASPSNIRAWRDVTRVRLRPGQNRKTHTFQVALPSLDRDKPVVFTAYAFNEDRVKGETATNDKFKVPEHMPARRPRAYIVSIGVDRYDLESRRLSFAAKDARDLGAALSRIKGHEIVQLTLLSENAGAGSTASAQATKANIRSVLELLAGKSEAERERLRHVTGIEKSVIEQLRKATPDDLVIIAFSGHGHTNPDTGQFYLLPSDSGKDLKMTSAALSKFISSEELSQWLRAIDARQMAMIIDACHAAASVETPGFKPGPMGDRGLGQLAYDKGMMILAATQADDVALEVRNIRQGLLTHALVVDGLEERASESNRYNADINDDGVLTLREWLQYAEQRVPSLYDDVFSGKLMLVPRDPYPVDPDWRGTAVRKAQTPSLFDFQRSSFSAEFGSIVPSK